MTVGTLSVLKRKSEIAFNITVRNWSRWLVSNSMLLQICVALLSYICEQRANVISRLITASVGVCWRFMRVYIFVEEKTFSVLIFSSSTTTAENISVNFFKWFYCKTTLVKLTGFSTGLKTFWKYHGYWYTWQEHWQTLKADFKKDLNYMINCVKV